MACKFDILTRSGSMVPRGSFFGSTVCTHAANLSIVQFLFCHDVVVENVRDRVLNSHFARHTETPAGTGTRYDLQHPISPEAFGAHSPPSFCGGRWVAGRKEQPRAMAAIPRAQPD